MMGRKGSDLRKQVEEMVSAAEAQGFRVLDRGANYMVLAKAETGLVVLHKTPSDIRGIRNARAQLRAIGVQV
jgi:hypothetical protein